MVPSVSPSMPLLFRLLLAWSSVAKRQTKQDIHIDDRPEMWKCSVLSEAVMQEWFGLRELLRLSLSCGLFCFGALSSNKGFLSHCETIFATSSRGDVTPAKHHRCHSTFVRCMSCCVLRLCSDRALQRYSEVSAHLSPPGAQQPSLGFNCCHFRG